MNFFSVRLFSVVMIILLVSACSPKISGTVRLFDADMQPVLDESPEGTVVNMINTTSALEEASHSVTVDKEGAYESAEDAIKPGDYKVETRKIGYETETRSIEIGSHTREEIDFELKKINEGKRRSIRGAESDEDKIINPGEVNIQPPMM